MYFGDGVYAEFDGFNITLRANGDGVHTPATDTIVFEPGILTIFNEWVKSGHRDYNTGLTFEETNARG